MRHLATMTNETISTDGHAGISGPVLKRAPIILDFCIFVLFEENLASCYRPSCFVQAIYDCVMVFNCNCST